MSDFEFLHKICDSLANLFMVCPILLLFILPKVSDHLASSAHLQAPDLHGDRTKPEPRSEQNSLLYLKGLFDWKWLNSLEEILGRRNFNLISICRVLRCPIHNGILQTFVVGKKWYLYFRRSDEGLKGTVVNCIYHSLSGKSLEITSKVPLIPWNCYSINSNLLCGSAEILIVWVESLGRVTTRSWTFSQSEKNRILTRSTLTNISHKNCFLIFLTLN